MGYGYFAHTLACYGSVTRFVKISPFGQKYKPIWQHFVGLFVPILRVLRQILYAFGLMFIVVNSHKMKK